MNKSNKKEIIELVKVSWKEDVDSINDIEILKNSLKYLDILNTIESMYDPKDQCIVDRILGLKYNQSTLYEKST